MLVGRKMFSAKISLSSKRGKSQSFNIRQDLQALEEQEEKEHNAVKVIIQAYKTYRTRTIFRNLIRQNYVKFFDKAKEQYLYKNKMSGNVFKHKPSFLGEEDLPLHKSFEAPIDYNPGQREGGIGFGLVVTVASFLSAKIPLLPENVLHDHEDIVDALKHDFFGRLLPENVISLKDPRRSDFTESFEWLKRMTTKTKKENVFVFIYICTHVATISNKKKNGNDKESEEENCYFLMKDSNWKEPQSVSMSSISLVELTGLLNDLSCTQKSILVNCAHVPRQKLSIFGNAKLLYPPNDFMCRLSQLSNSVVITSCLVGVTLSSLIKQGYVYCIDGVGDSDKNRDAAIRDYYRREWLIPADRPMLFFPPPEKPRVRWTRDPSSGEVRVMLPTDKQMRNYGYKIFTGSLSRLFKRPINSHRSYSNNQDKKRIKAPIQISLLAEKNSYFGAAVVGALRGGACIPDEDTVTAGAFMRSMYELVQEQVKKENQRIEELNQRILEDAGDVAKIKIALPMVAQNPIMVVPVNELSLIHNAVCYRCTPPPAPDTPFIEKVSSNWVTLSWANPTFEGSPPTHYRISMQNVSRNYNKWALLEKTGVISKTSFRINNLPAGMRCQFRVEGFSNGGWGAPSMPSDWVCPGEQQAPISFETRWKRIAQGGPLAVIDRLVSNRYIREDWERGFHLLYVFGQREDGFLKGVTAMKVASIVLDGLSMYPEDPRIAGPGFNALGYALRSPNRSVEVEEYLVNSDIKSICLKHFYTFRHDSIIVNALIFLQSCFSGSIDILPVDSVDDENELALAEEAVMTVIKRSSIPI